MELINHWLKSNIPTCTFSNYCLYMHILCSTHCTINISKWPALKIKVYQSILNNGYHWQDPNQTCTIKQNAPSNTWVQDRHTIPLASLSYVCFSFTQLWIETCFSFAWPWTNLSRKQELPGKADISQVPLGTDIPSPFKLPIKCPQRRGWGEGVVPLLYTKQWPHLTCSKKSHQEMFFQHPVLHSYQFPKEYCLIQQT